MRDFDAWVAEQKQEALTFRLGARDFTVPCPIPAIALLNLGTREAQVGSLFAFREFLDVILPKDDHEAFVEALTVSGISGDGIIELVKWLVEEATKRPTLRRSDLPPSPSPNGRRSKRGSSSTDSTPVNAQPVGF